MLPQVKRYFLRATAGAIVAVATLVAGCGREESPEAQVRTVIAAGEAAAESRDLAGILEHVSPAFQDGNGDGVGDTPHQLMAYADQIWMELPVARFFRSSPVMELLDFLERLAPFSAPDLILRDEKPRFAKPDGTARS